jgi:predicted RNA-binding protein with TRAM domain
MEIPDELQCLFTADVEETRSAYRITVPKREVKVGALSAGSTYKVAVLSQEQDADADDTETTTPSQSTDSTPEPPVAEGETRTVEIEDVGDQGDGLTRVDRGFVVIVPDTELGERVRIEIEDVRETVAFGTVVERISYYD